MLSSRRLVDRTGKLLHRSTQIWTFAEKELERM